jgi:hypothetical protein
VLPNFSVAAKLAAFKKSRVIRRKLLLLLLLLLLLVVVVVVVVVVVFRLLKRTLGPKRDEVTAVWRKRHNEELHDLHFSPSVIKIMKSRKMRWAGHVARMGAKEAIYMLLVRKPERKSTLGRPSLRWMRNNKMGLVDIGWNSLDSIGMAKDRYRWKALVYAVMNFRVQ